MRKRKLLDGEDVGVDDGPLQLVQERGYIVNIIRREPPDDDENPPHGYVEPGS